MVQEAAEMILSSAVKGILVYAENDGRQIVACRSGDNNLLSACIDVSLELFLRAVEAGALENYVNADFAPRAVR